MLEFTHYFSKPEIDPFDEIKWEKRTASIKDGTKTIFHQEVEVPSFWSQNATDIVAQHYFKVVNGEKETSVKQCVSRVSKAFSKAGIKNGYFDKEVGRTFERELRWLLVHQYICFNSPVWYNLGVEKEGQLSACFIQSVKDSIESLCQLQTNETMLFRNGSGTGTNFSTLRELAAPLSNGGSSSGPVSFVKGFDTWAGITKSAGKTRRAAKMVILNVDHPDIEDFIKSKVTVEKMARDLIKMGWPADYNSETYSFLPYQNANHSVRVTDDFMKAVEQDKNFDLINFKKVKVKELSAKNLFRTIAEAAHLCADPGIQFDTTINSWHTSPNSGRINAANPCCIVGETKIFLRHKFEPFLYGVFSIKDINEVIISEYNAVCLNTNTYKLEYHPFIKLISGKTTELIKLTIEDISITSNKTEDLIVRLTPEHRVLANYKWVAASELKKGDKLVSHSVNRYNQTLSFPKEGERYWSASGRNAIVKDIILEKVNSTEVYDLSIQNPDKATHNFFVVNSKDDFAALISNSEYMFVDDSACNLASHNLVKYYKDREFNIEAFVKATEITITAMEIAVAISSYPTKEIAENSKRLRPLGIGWANGGALLMRMGLPYDSDKGRFWLSSITSLLTASAYFWSAKIAELCGGPFEDFEKNKTEFLSIIRKHADANYKLRHLAIEAKIEDLRIVNAAENHWRNGEELGFQHGFRNAQASVLAPTGTIGFMMDCDTTGIEPDIALIKHKKLAGGGWLKIVNQSVGPALESLGYSFTEIEMIEEHILKYETILGAPNLKKEHLPIFDCAVGIRFIKPMGHIKMMAACQPFLSGAISKTVNLPASASVADIEDAYMQAWKLGLKAVAIYRDGCKGSQPLNVKDYTEETDQKCNFCGGKVQRAGSCLVCIECGTPSSCS